MPRLLDPAAVLEVAAALRGAASALFITGAGMSADSGLPTYRGIGGLYEDQATEDGVPIEIALSGAMFARRPELCWKHIRRIEAACRGARPHRGHEVLAELERRLPRCLVLTQNVDGLHQAAGSREVVAIHGDVHDLECTRCSWRDRVADYSGLPDLPRCPSCAAVVRPSVVLFGERLPEPALLRLESEVARGFDVVLSIGTTSVFPYIAAPVYAARSRGGFTAEINPGTTEISDAVNLRLRGGARAALESIFEAFATGSSAVTGREPAQ